MTGKTFLDAVAQGKTDILQVFLNILAKTRTPFQDKTGSWIQNEGCSLRGCIGGKDLGIYGCGEA